MVLAVQSSTGDRKQNVLDRITYRLMETDAEKDAIYRLRYRAYLHEGAIEPKDEPLLKDKFDDLPNSWTFGIFVDAHLTSSLRISVASRETPVTPAVDAFGDLLEPELAQGKIIVDPNRFVADPDVRTKIPELPYMTVRLGYVACGHFGANIGTATVRAEHRAFYRKVFLQQPLCEPRPYPTLTKPLCLMAADYPTVREVIYKRYPFFRASREECAALFTRTLEQAP